MTKYETVLEALEKRISELSPGTRFPTVRDLMAEFKASQATIDHALDILSSKRLIARRGGHGIFTANPDSQSSAESFRLALAMPNFPSAINELHLTKICAKAEEAGHRVQLLRYDWRDRILRALPNRSCDALLLLPAVGAGMTGSEIARISSFNVPTLVLNELSGVSLDCVFTDNAHGGAMAANYFAKLGHRRLAVLYGEPESRTMEARIAGFANQCSLMGLPAPKIIDCAMKSGQSPAAKSCETLLKEIKRGALEFSALFCLSDASALGALHAFYEAGLEIPGDASVLGFDGLPEGAFFNPSLSSVEQDLDALAAKAIEIVSAKLRDASGENVPCQTPIPPKILERGSTAIAKGGKPC